MKKTVFLVTALFVSTFFMSCSSSDDSVENTIIGKWQLEQRFNDEKEEVLSDDCEKKSTLEFKTDNTFIDAESFTEQNNPCISSTDPGTWEANGEGTLNISYDGEPDVQGITYSFTDGKLTLVSDLIDDVLIRTIWKRID